MKLCNHIIFANSLVHLKTNYHQYEWEWTTKIAAITPDSSFIHDILDPQTSTRGLLSLTDMIQAIERKQNQKFIWMLIYSALGLAGAVLFIICVLLNQLAVYYTSIFEGLNHLSIMLSSFGDYFLPRIPFIIRLMLCRTLTMPVAHNCDASGAFT